MFELVCVWVGCVVFDAYVFDCCTDTAYAVCIGCSWLGWLSAKLSIDGSLLFIETDGIEGGGISEFLYYLTISGSLSYEFNRL